MIKKESGKVLVKEHERPDMSKPRSSRLKSTKKTSKDRYTVMIETRNEKVNTLTPTSTFC